MCRVCSACNVLSCNVCSMYITFVIYLIFVFLKQHHCGAVLERRNTSLYNKKCILSDIFKCWFLCLCSFLWLWGMSFQKSYPCSIRKNHGWFCRKLFESEPWFFTETPSKMRFSLRFLVTFACPPKQKSDEAKCAKLGTLGATCGSIKDWKRSTCPLNTLDTLVTPWHQWDFWHVKLRALGSNSSAIFVFPCAGNPAKAKANSTSNRAGRNASRERNSVGSVAWARRDCSGFQGALGEGHQSGSSGKTLLDVGTMAHVKEYVLYFYSILCYAMLCYAKLCYAILLYSIILFYCNYFILVYLLYCCTLPYDIML